MAKAIRDFYGEALVKYGAENTDVVVLDADVSGSTKSCMFRDACPDRFFNMGIAEANMVGVAAGLASVGKIPFVNTFATFLTSIGLIGARAFGSYSKLGIKMMGAYGGLSDSFDGPSHHSIEDIAIMRTQPNFKVYVPCDGVQTDWLIRHSISDRSPMYIRLSRDAFPEVYQEGQTFADGKGSLIKSGRDGMIIACGLMVGQALEACKLLAADGLDVGVADMFCIKPIDQALVLECAKSGAIVTAEEHSVIGGLGGAVAEVLCQANAKVPVGFVGMQDCHAECGPYQKLLEAYGLDAAAIAEKMRQTIAKK